MAATALDNPRVANNVADRLLAIAETIPDQPAVVEPAGYEGGRRQYRQVSFRELARDVRRIARGLGGLGVTPGMRLALMVRPGIDFVALVFALLRAGAVQVLIDPGMGRKNLLRCLDEVRPQGFIAIPVVHAVRALLGRRYADATLNVTVGRRWLGKGPTLEDVRRRGERSDRNLPETAADDPAAIIFTTGSTGPPKGVLYSHRNFDTQVTEIRDRFGIQPGEVDLAGFPLFGLFNGAMGVTTVIPDMDPTRPAKVDPEKITEAVRDWQVTQSFGSPALWKVVGNHCSQRGIRLPTLRRVFSAGAPVPAQVLERLKGCLAPEAEIYTPYGATEALPVCCIEAREVLEQTRGRTDEGAGVCVGTKVDSVEWKIVRPTDEPLESIENVEELPLGEIGELIVRGPQVTGEYVTRTEWNSLAKIHDAGGCWHRMGDLGYFDRQGRYWFCGRRSHRVETRSGPLYTVPCEGIFNTHPAVERSALVGVGEPRAQVPVIVVQPVRRALLRSPSGSRRLLQELQELAARHSLTQSVEHFLLRPDFPVDIRHNAKIFREQLAAWAARKLRARLR